MKLNYSEDQLTRFSKCNLLDISEPEPEYLAAYKTTKWVLLKAAENHPITKNIITTKFELEYKLFFIDKEKDKKYWHGIRLGRRFISKLFWLLSKYFVLQPIQTYTYRIPTGQSVSGEYAIIQKRTESEKPLVLVLNYNRPLYFLYPDVLSSARWIHAKENYLDIGIYNFAMFRGDDWKHKNLVEPLIFNWIFGILNQISSEKIYVTPGSHCLSCKSHKCLEGYYA